MTRRYASMTACALAVALTCVGCRVAGVGAQPEDRRGGSALTEEELALLSFQVSEKVEPEPAVLGQIERHIAAIAKQEPLMQSVVIRKPFNARELILEVDESTSESMATGKYEAWSQLHAGLNISRVQVSGQTAFIDYSETYNTPALVRRYETLPGVSSAAPSWLIGDGSWIYIQRRGDEWHYIVDIASGDCIAGCAKHQLLYFVLDAVGRVQRKDQWLTPNAEVSPAWVEEWRKRRRAR